MKSKYNDVPSIMQVIGGILTKPSLLDMEEKYNFREEDFIQPFHRVLFGSIYNLYHLGANSITAIDIENYLEQRPKQLSIYRTHKGAEYLEQLKDNTQLEAFDYYYNRMKKFTLLRMYDNIGLNLTDIYDIDNILDVNKKQRQEQWLDDNSLEDIAAVIDDKITDIKLKYVDGANDDFNQAGEGIAELLETLETTPAVGIPLYGKYVNAIHRGARLTKFFLRSAPAGTGKTRAMIADACYVACDEIYNPRLKKWEHIGTKEPTLFTCTELQMDELQTLMLAFVSGVDESHILDSLYFEGEKERVAKAAEILKNSPLYVKKMPDFSLQDIENAIKYAVRQWNVRYVFHDYIHSSIGILSEISGKAGVKGLREDNVLFMLAVRLKDLCNEYGIFIESATQLNGDYKKEEQSFDQNLLRGAKSIADKIDIGEIILHTNKDDIEKLEPILKKGGFEKPDMKISVYKNRRGKYNNILLWCKSDLGTCRIEPMFVTDYSFNLLPIEDLKIKVNPRDF